MVAEAALPAFHELPELHVAGIRGLSLGQGVFQLEDFRPAVARVAGPDVPTSPHAVGRRVRRVEEAHFE